MYLPKDCPSCPLCRGIDSKCSDGSCKLSTRCDPVSRIRLQVGGVNSAEIVSLRVPVDDRRGTVLEMCSLAKELGCAVEDAVKRLSQKVSYGCPHLKCQNTFLAANLYYKEGCVAEVLKRGEKMLAFLQAQKLSSIQMVGLPLIHGNMPRHSVRIYIR